MRTDWLNFINSETESAAPYPEQQEFLCSCEHLGVMEVLGDDALSFLQNQLSNDLTKIDDTNCQLNSYSSHKGRMFSIFYVLKYKDGFLIILPRSQIDFLCQRLQMFVIMAKVTITDVSDQWAKIGSISSDNNANATQVIHSDNAIQVQLNPNNKQRVLTLCSLESAQNFWNSLKSHLMVCSTNAWHLAEINEGIPSLTPETSEAFVLQMSNLQLLDGVSFKKGCYPGQEIVARTKYLGKAKRRMYLAQVETTSQPLPNQEVCESSSEASDGSGKIVLSAQSGENQYDFLFVGNIKKTESGTLKLLGESNAEISLKELPYSFEE